MPDPEPDHAPALPRPSATVLILRDDPFRVLMVRRSKRIGDAFSSALVFPGGVVEPGDRDAEWSELVDGAEGFSADERALRIAACRETFEEVGVLLGDPSGDAPPPSIENPRTENFAAMLRSMGRRLPLPDLEPFAHWITPAISPRRFDTHFFLARMPGGAEAVCDGSETVALEWATPDDLVARAEAGRDGILFPTRLNLKRLAESRNVDEAFAMARARKPFTVEPRGEHRDGRFVVIIPIEAGYGVTEDWRPD